MRTLAIALLFLVGCSCVKELPKVAENPCAALSEDCQPLRVGLRAKHTVQRALLELPMLINGVPAEPGDFPASVYARAGNAACSATIVGERVLFMASHCMVNGGVVTFSAHANSYSARCTHHPEYSTNSTADWALCLIDRPVTGIPFEVLGVHESLEVGDTILMSGYGCIKPGGGGGNDGIFRVGHAVIEGMPDGKAYDVVTKGGAALCFGDSGGSAYHVHEDGSRFIFGVNSRGDIDTMSYLPGVFAPTFIAWAKAWAKVSNNVKMCGVHGDAASCRMAQTSADAKWEVNGETGCAKGVVKSEFLDKKADIVGRVQNALKNQ